MSAFDEFDVFRNILESLLTGVCVVDMQKKIVFWSDGAERITGHLRHEVIGRSCVDSALLYSQQPGCEFCADQRLRKPEAPLDPANRRISVIVQYITKNADDATEHASGGETEHQAAVPPKKYSACPY
jgi:PAS domain S-box-containing protein